MVKIDSAITYRFFKQGLCEGEIVRIEASLKTHLRLPLFLNLFRIINLKPGRYICLVNFIPHLFSCYNFKVSKHFKIAAFIRIIKEINLITQLGGIVQKL